jgi:hypothetical protein
MFTRVSSWDCRRTAARAIAAPAATLALLLLTSCSTDSIFSSAPPAAGSQSSSPSFSQRFSSLFSTGSPATATTGVNPDLAGQEIDCPTIDVRPGASTYSVNAATNDPSVLGLRYQGTLGQTARECARAGSSVAMKIGVQGRIILGPAGGPGQIEVPLRLAIVHEGPEPKTIWTKFYRIPLEIPAGQSNIPFTQVEQDVSFPMPPPGDLQNYVVYIGFDPQGLRQAPERKPPPRRR